MAWAGADEITSIAAAYELSGVADTDPTKQIAVCHVPVLSLVYLQKNDLSDLPPQVSPYQFAHTLGILHFRDAGGLD